jgi:5-methylcytosine-specific restriction enzyme A
MAKNPPWTRDELILALDLYFRVGRKQVDPPHPEVIALSTLLNQLPIHGASSAAADFRNPTGVSMKLGNFLAHDPAYPGVGLKRGNKLEAEVWREFASNPARLREVARSIGEGVQEASVQEQVDEEDEFIEGQILSRLHQARERNRKAISQKKAKVLKETGGLACEVCDFDFEATYGELGKGYAECHHLVPLSELPNRKITKLTDLAILCSNCHSMIHRAKPFMGTEEFKRLLAAVHNSPKKQP